MELDFDKEIDALLRKARGGTEAAAVTPSPAHLDADDIAAFAENALPEKTRQAYIVHFAECDRCRKILSQSILFNTEAAQIAAASPEIAAPVVQSSTWRQRLFGMPTVAYTMGALVLLFSGFLGIAVWQNMSSSRNAEVSQIEQKETYSTANSAANTALATNAAANAANSTSTATNTMVVPANPTIAGQAPLSAANAAENTAVAGPVGRTVVTPNPADQPKTLGQGADTKAPAPAAAAPPAPKDTQEEAKVTADKVAASKDDRNREDLNKEKQAESEMRVMKKEAPVTEMRSMNNLPLNGRKTMPMMDGAVAATRTVNGRTFTKKDGVWYDGEYHGQSTVNVRRGTDAYKKLDGGIRSIADSLGGTVVTVWKGKAYRIQ